MWPYACFVSDEHTVSVNVILSPPVAAQMRDQLTPPLCLPIFDQRHVIFFVCLFFVHVTEKLLDG